MVRRHRTCLPEEEGYGKGRQRRDLITSMGFVSPVSDFGVVLCDAFMYGEPELEKEKKSIKKKHTIVLW